MDDASWKNLSGSQLTLNARVMARTCSVTFATKNQHGEYFSHQEITDHMIFLLFAAHDTTTSALTMVMHLLARNQDWQDQLRDNILNSNIDELNYDQLDSLPLIDHTFKEVLRMYPTVSGVMRRTIRPCEVGG